MSLYGNQIPIYLFINCFVVSAVKTDCILQETKQVMDRNFATNNYLMCKHARCVVTGSDFSRNRRHDQGILPKASFVLTSIQTTRIPPSWLNLFRFMDHSLGGYSTNWRILIIWRIHWNYSLKRLKSYSDLFTGNCSWPLIKFASS